jgi:hypothetical protein
VIFAVAQLFYTVFPIPLRAQIVLFGGTNKIAPSLNSATGRTIPQSDIDTTSRRFDADL